MLKALLIGALLMVPADATVIAARSDPAVRQIATTQEGAVAVATPKPTRAFTALFAKAEAHAKAGRIPATRQAKLRWVLTTALADVDRHLAPAKPYKEVGGTRKVGCTGFWVTPQGHMVTAASCTGLEGKALLAYFAQGTTGLMTENVKAFTAKHKITEADLIDLATRLFTAFDHKHRRLTKSKTTIVLVGKGAPALSVVARGARWPGADFALLKARGMKNLPTLPLGGGVAVGDMLYGNGYPEVSWEFDEKSAARPTLAKGIVNAKRVTVGKVTYLQTQMPIYPGSQGGPVFDRHGKVVGTSVAVATDERVGGATENSTFVLPVGVIRQQLAEAGVTPVLSRTSSLYFSALDDYFARRHKPALLKFRQVLRLHPQHLYVRGYIAELTAR
ncbi:serine protease [Nonomuraea sp. NPDC050663]|uniref:serine protease n=1 Tax=Nonomuraea sp. NPDC050663 TaxID=3364370 RepID=UPI0037A1E95A